MKKILLIAFILAQICVMGQEPRIYYLKVADKPEYQKYLNYCNDSIAVMTVQWGKATVKNTNTLGLDYEMFKATAGNYIGLTNNFQSIKVYSEEFGHLLKDTVWYKPWKPGLKTPSLSFTANQVPLIRGVLTKVPRRIASIPDFYANWKTGLIKP